MCFNTLCNPCIRRFKDLEIVFLSTLLQWVRLLEHVLSFSKLDCFLKPEQVVEALNYSLPTPPTLVFSSQVGL